MKLLVSTSYTVKCKREVGLFSLDTRKPIQSRSSDLTVAATEMNCLQMTVPKNKVEEEKGGRRGEREGKGGNGQKLPTKSKSKHIENEVERETKGKGRGVTPRAHDFI